MYSPTLFSQIGIISGLLDEAEVLVGYNHIAFDILFLESKGVNVPPVLMCDVMLEYSEKHGEWDEEHGNYHWISLIRCAGELGIELRAHDCLEDTKATLRCFETLSK